METLKRKIEYGDVLEEHLVELVDHDVRAPMANFAYFLTISKDRAIAENDDKNYFPLLESFFSSSGFLLENLINWRRFISQEEDFGNFHADVIVQEILLSINYLLVDKDIKIENLIDEGTICFGNKTVYTFVLKNIILSCLAYNNKGSNIKINVCANEKTYISVTAADIYISDLTLKALQDISQYKKILGKDIGLLLSKQILQHYGGALDITCDKETGTVFTFCFYAE